MLMPKWDKGVWERSPSSSIGIPAIYHQMVIYSLMTLNSVVFEISARFFMEQNVGSPLLQI